MTAVVIALAAVAWVVVVLLCLGLARSAALGDVILRRAMRVGGRHGRRAA